jgi:hypothetical protein
MVSDMSPTLRHRRPVEPGLARRSLRQAPAGPDHVVMDFAIRLVDGDPVSLDLRVLRALAREGDLGVSRFTYWYTGRPPVHEAILARPVAEPG